MAFVASIGMTRPAGYSDTGQTAHNVDANGHEEFIMKLRRYLCGVPELDFNVTPITVVGTHDSAISKIDGSDGSMTLGTWQIRRQDATTLRIVEPGPTNHDITVTWGTLIKVNVFGDSGVAPLSFWLDDTGGDPLSGAEGWDLEFVANGLPAAERWHREAISLDERTTPDLPGVVGTENDPYDFEMVLRGRKLSGVTDPTLVPDDEKFFVELASISATGSDLFQLAHQWVSLVPDYALPEFPAQAIHQCRSSMWTEHGVTGARTMPYYIVANHRFCAYVVNVDGIWHGGYFGLLDSFSTAAQFPLPWINGGTVFDQGDIYTQQSKDVCWGMMSNLSSPAQRSNSYFRSSTGEFKDLKGTFADTGGGPGAGIGIVNGLTDGTCFWPMASPSQYVSESGIGTTVSFGQSSASVGLDTLASTAPLRGAIDGTKVFLPLILIESSVVGALDRSSPIGTLPSCFWVNGFGVSSGDIVTSGSRDFVIIQNVYRTGEQSFWALELV